MSEKHQDILPIHFKTMTEKWKIIGGFTSDYERDQFGIEHCTHFFSR